MHPHTVLKPVLDLPQHLREIGGKGTVDHDHFRIKGVEKIVDSIGHITDKILKKRQGVIILLVAGGYKGVNIRMFQSFYGGKLFQDGTLGSVLLQTA